MVFCIKQKSMFSTGFHSLKSDCGTLRLSISLPGKQRNLFFLEAGCFMKSEPPLSCSWVRHEFCNSVKSSSRVCWVCRVCRVNWVQVLNVAEKIASGT